MVGRKARPQPCRVLRLVLYLCCCLLCACGGVAAEPLHGAGNAMTTPSAAQGAALAPAWQPLAERLAADGLAGPQVEALLATLPATPTQSPMGRKMRELYKSKFLATPEKKPAPRYYKGVVTERNAHICQEFIAAHAPAFQNAEARYQVPAEIAVALLFVETRLGKVLGANSENALYTLASMAVSRKPADIIDWLGEMPGHEERLDWFAETMPKRADWAYREVKALLLHLLREGGDPRSLPGSIYGAVGLCQFMPSNIPMYGADGDGDGRVDLFTVGDAVASLSNYLVRHGWRKGLSYAQQQKILMRYNKSRVYADTILALADLVTKSAGNITGKNSGERP
ncbi:MAG: lytic murein transglycosylase [Desulfovibrionaceae bacterium]|nr:lytic murein transglycosylase [Desulfovibrionaceae bacterium]